MPAYFNPVDALKIAVISFAFIWAANKGLDKLGLSDYRA